MIKEVTVERLYNLGNYENIRLAATATVESGEDQEAFAEARAAVEAHYAAFLEERAAAERKQQEEWEAKRQRRLAEQQAQRQRPTSADEDENPF